MQQYQGLRKTAHLKDRQQQRQVLQTAREKHRQEKSLPAHKHSTKHECSMDKLVVHWDPINDHTYSSPILIITKISKYWNTYFIPLLPVSYAYALLSTKLIITGIITGNIRALCLPMTPFEVTTLFLPNPPFQPYAKFSKWQRAYIAIY